MELSVRHKQILKRINEYFLQACNQGNIHEANRLYKQYLEITIEDINNLSEIDCRLLNQNINLLLTAFKNSTNLIILKWLYQNLNKFLNKEVTHNLKHDTGIEVYEIWILAFTNCTENGQLNSVKWLFDKSLTGIFDGIFNGIFAYEATLNSVVNLPLYKKCLLWDNFGCFRKACYNNNLEMMKYLFHISNIYKCPISLSGKNLDCFEYICNHSNLEIVKWFYTIFSRKDKNFNNIQDIYTRLLSNKTNSEKQSDILDWLSETKELKDIKNMWVIV